MIFDLILKFLYYFASLILNVLPNASLDSGIGSAISSIGSTLYKFDYFFDGSVLLTILLLIFTIEIIINGFRVFTWIYQRIRG